MSVSLHNTEELFSEVRIPMQALLEICDASLYLYFKTVNRVWSNRENVQPTDSRCSKTKMISRRFNFRRHKVCCRERNMTNVKGPEPNQGWMFSHSAALEEKFNLYSEQRRSYESNAPLSTIRSRDLDTQSKWKPVFLCSADRETKDDTIWSAADVEDNQSVRILSIFFFTFVMFTCEATKYKNCSVMCSQQRDGPVDTDLYHVTA